MKQRNKITKEYSGAKAVVFAPEYDIYAAVSQLFDFRNG